MMNDKGLITFKLRKNENIPLHLQMAYQLKIALTL